MSDSLTAGSSAADAPRGLGFLYSPNRFNVATSRARCTCILVASPSVLAAECRTPDQMRWVNGVCRFTERATVMPLWFMVFGGTVPIGNLIFGVVIEWIGARAVLGFGAAFALFLSWWLDLRRLPPSAFLPESEGGEPLSPPRAR